MKLPHPSLVIIGLLTTLLLLSIVLNGLIYQHGKEYYLQLNKTRLDPSGLQYFDTALEARKYNDPQLTRIVLFGDSRAAQWPAPELNHFEFINRGIGSQTSAQAIGRFTAHVKSLAPQVVIIQVGINDLKTISLFPKRSRAIIDNCKKNIRRLVIGSADIGARVIVSTIFPTGKVPVERKLFWSNEISHAVNDVNEFIHTLRSKNVLIFDAHTLLAGKDGKIRPEYSRDLLHLNTTGYKHLNAELATILKKLH